MCVAIVKKEGYDIPNYKTLEKCYDANPDGCGFAFASDNKVIISKGYMDFKGFWKALKKANKKFNLKDKNVLIHFRIATHGGVSSELTHPFPITDDNNQLRATDIISNYAMVHNGILSICTTGLTKKSELSDSATFAKKYLFPLSHNKDWLQNKYNQQLIQNMIDSSNKVAILDKNNNVWYSEGFTEIDGVLYSNTYWNYTYHYNSKKSSKFSWANDAWDIDDYWDYGVSPNESECTVKLQRINPGEVIRFDNGYTEFTVNEECRYYIDAESELYIADDTIDENLEDERDFEAYGHISVFDSNGEEITGFVGDIEIPVDYIFMGYN